MWRGLVKLPKAGRETAQSTFPGEVDCKEGEVACPPNADDRVVVRLPPPAVGWTLGLAQHPKLARLVQDPKAGLGILSPQQPDDPMPSFWGSEELLVTAISTEDHSWTLRTLTKGTAKGSSKMLLPLEPSSSTSRASCSNRMWSSTSSCLSGSILRAYLEKSQKHKAQVSDQPRKRDTTRQETPNATTTIVAEFATKHKPYCLRQAQVELSTDGL